jgi:hypothetical protein
MREREILSGLFWRGACGGLSARMIDRAAKWRRASRILGVIIVGGCLLGTVSATLANASSRRTLVSLSGRIGAVEINASTRSQIIHAVGRPAYAHSGNIGQGAPTTPNYQLLGYQCRELQSFTSCAVNYYLNASRHRLESFSTTSTAFMLPGGVHVGMPAGQAARIEHEPDTGGCVQGIWVRTRKLLILIATRGGRIGRGDRVTGGRVAAILLDDRRYGVGVTVCL